MPKEMSFFNKGEENNGDFIQKELQHFHNTVNIARGDEVEIAFGDTKGLIGIVKDLRGNIAIIEPKKNLGVNLIE
jgi:transcription elongation factor